MKYRWLIGGLLFASTVINYIDRQTFNVLGPHLKQQFAWSNADFAVALIAFRISYSIMQAVSGRLVDRLGTRNGLTIAVTFYSVIAMLTPLAPWLGGHLFALGIGASAPLVGFAVFRFLLGVGEAANWPAATKAVEEWFPRRERGWAVALFDSGSSIGAAIAPFIVLGLYARFGDWRPAFVVTGSLGFIWLFFWRRVYHTPAMHPRIDPAERAMIEADKVEEAGEIAAAGGSTGRAPYSQLLRLPQTWGTLAARGLSDPTWFFIADWFAVFLVSRGYNLEETLVGFWVPFLAADLGNFFGGGLSSRLIARGWPVGRARRVVIVGGSLGILMLIPAIWVESFPVLIACFGIATFSYAAYSTMAISLPADLFHSQNVAAVAGLSGTAAGIGTIISIYLIGQITDQFSFAPILVGASLVPLVGAVLVLLLVRNTADSGKGLLKRI
jgi:ACS family hexuronate transporter-like MFS transporter